MTPPDFASRLGAVDGNAFAIEPTLHQSAYFRRAEPRAAASRGLYHVGGGTHPGAGHPGRAARRPGDAGLVTRRARPPRRTAPTPACARVSAVRLPHEVAEARARRQRVARTFALACRLLPARRARRRLPALPRLPHARRPRRRRPPGRGRAASAAVERWAAGEPGDGRARRACWPTSRRGTDLPRDALVDFCAGMRDDLDGTRRTRPRPTSTATATASPAPSAW